MLKSIEYFEQAIEIDPEYALAYAGIADAYVTLGEWDNLPVNEAYPKAREQAQKALEIDSKLAEAYSSLAVIKKLYDWDWPGAEVAYKRSIELNPNYATAHFRYAEYLVALGKFDDAISEIRKAQELDPLSPIVHVAGALVYYYARQYEKALDMCQKALDLDPNYMAAYVYLSLIHYQLKNYDESFSAQLKSLILDNEDPKQIELREKLFEIYQTSGLEDAAQYYLETLKKAQELKNIDPASFIDPYVTLKDKEQLMDVLEKSYERRPYFMHLLKVDPDYDFIRSEPRFKALLKKVGLDN